MFLAVGVGTSQGAPSAFDVRVAQAKPVTLKLWVSGPYHQRVLPGVVQRFEEANPGIKVEALTLDWTVYQQKILTAFAGGAGPDVLSFYSVDVAAWAVHGILAPLDQHINRADFAENALDSGVWDNRVYAIPWAMRPRPFFYRKDFLKEAGYDRAPRTWDELRQYAQKLVKRDASGNIERVGFWIPTSHPYKTVQMWLAFLWSNGGDVFDAAGKKAAFNSQEGVASVEFLADFLNRHKVDKPGSIKNDPVDFMQGKVAMLVSNNATRGVMRDAPQLRDSIGIAVPPISKVPAMELSGEMFGISKVTKHPVEALKLLRFMTMNTDIVVQFLAGEDTLPALKAAMTSDYVRTNPWVSQFLEVAKVGRPLPKHPKWAEVSRILTSALDEVYLRGRSAKDALDAAAQKVNNLLAQ